MTLSQIERLKKDARAIDHYVANLKKKGKDRKVHKLLAKQAFLNQTIEEANQLNLRG